MPGKALTLDGNMSRLVLDASTSSLWYWLKLVNHSFWLTRARSGLNLKKLEWKTKKFERVDLS